jgi:uncharacterized membrane protein
MNIHFTEPLWLLALIPALAWVFWLGWRTDAQLSRARSRLALVLRVVVTVALVFALAGMKWRRSVEGMNVFFVLDRSESVPTGQQETARELVNKLSAKKEKSDKSGLIVFGSDASIDRLPNEKIDVQKIEAVVDPQRSDLAAAIRLGTAAFPEAGQKRLVLMTDGNENIGDAMAAAAGAKSQGVTVDVLPLGVARGNDVFVQKVQLPPKLKKGQPFDVKIFVQSDIATTATVKLYRNELELGEQKVQLEAGKNLFSFPQTLPEQGFYSYGVTVDTAKDPIPQNNRAAGFATVRGDPRILVISSDPAQDQLLAQALRTAKIELKLGGVEALPNSLAEMNSYDAIFLSNVSAGELGRETMQLLDSAVRDFGVGLVCIGGDNAFAAGGYRGSPLEHTLPVSMELDSKKVLPRGAVVLIMHGMEFANGNQVARDCAQGVLSALGPDDELGVNLWDGSDRWVLPLTKVGNKKAAATAIAGMNQGDMGSFEGCVKMAQAALKSSTANLKHIIVFSDGDPAAPSLATMQAIVGDRITLSTVLISGHSGPETMIQMAEQGKGRFYNVTSPNMLPQIFLKETAVILKSAIYEEPFKPAVKTVTEVTRGLGEQNYPTLFGYVATTEKLRAETPLWTHQGDPLLAHWQYGLGRAVAFTSDARTKWGRNWTGWDRYRQFWSQIGQWSLRRLENADFTTEVVVERGEGVITVEALDDKGEYRNFLDLQTSVVSPKGERMMVRLEQKGPGHYEAKFPTKDVGSYLLNMMEMEKGTPVGSQVVGANVSFSPEFTSPEPNLNLLRRLAESTSGKVLDPTKPGENPFQHDRTRTFQSLDMWEWLLRLAILLFVADVGIRRIQIDREEWLRATAGLRRILFFWKGKPMPGQTQDSLQSLLAAREGVRGARTAPGRAELFQPVQTPAPMEYAEAKDSGDGSQTSEASTPRAPLVTVESQAAETPPPPESGGTTSRLLEAKRRAQHRKK